MAAIRLPRPWDSPGKNTGVGCHFLLQYMKVKSENEVAQLCLTLSDPMDCSPPDSSIHGICQARVLEWGAIAFSVSNITSGYFWVVVFFLILCMFYFIYLLGLHWVYIAAFRFSLTVVNGGYSSL